MNHSLKYMDIVEWAKEQIAAGTFQPKKKFFSETKLGEVFGFSRQTVRRALEELEQMGYITRIKGSGTFITDHLSAQTFKPVAKEAASRVIGIISTHLDAYIFPSTIQGMEEVFSASGYTTLMTSTKNQLDGEHRALQIMLERSLDGLIVEPTRSGLPNINLELYRTISLRGIPIVFIDSCYPELSVPYVALDDEATGYIATKHLISLGHKDITGIFTLSDRQGHLRYKGYIKALIEQGLPIREEHIHWYTKETMLRILNSDELWEDLSACSAALCYNDSLALLLMDLLRQKGKRVPEDFSVIGIDNSEVAKTNSITSVAHPKKALGETAAKLLLSMIKGEEGTSVLFPPSLIIRGSAKNKEIMDEITQ